MADYFLNGNGTAGSPWNNPASASNAATSNGDVVNVTPKVTGGDAEPWYIGGNTLIVESPEVLGFKRNVSYVNQEGIYFGFEGVPGVLDFDTGLFSSYSVRGDQIS